MTPLSFYSARRARYLAYHGGSWAHKAAFDNPNQMESSEVQERMMRCGIEARVLLPTTLGELEMIANATLIQDQVPA